MQRALLVLGATGNQGGALIKALIKADANFEIIAVSRDSSSKSAQRLVQSSPKVKVITGDLERSAEIFKTAKQVTKLPIWGVYSVQGVSPFHLFGEPEVRQGNALIDAALENKVEMFVYSSVDRGGEASFDNPTDIPHFRTKHQIEHHLVESTKGTNMAYTILRPVAFMNNLQPGFVGKVFSTVYDMSLRKKPLQLIAPSDIGVFAASAFMRPDEYKNRAISLAGDDLTYDQFSQIFERKTGQPMPTTYRFVAWILTKLSAELGKMFSWFYTHGYNVDIEGLRKIHPGLKSFGDWLETESSWATQKRA